MELSNKELKDIAFQTLSPISTIDMISINEIWKLEAKHERELTVWRSANVFTGHEIEANITIQDDFTADQVKYLLLTEVNYLEEYFLNQKK